MVRFFDVGVFLVVVGSYHDVSVIRFGYTLREDCKLLHASYVRSKNKFNWSKNVGGGAVDVDELGPVFDRECFLSTTYGFTFVFALPLQRVFTFVFSMAFDFSAALLAAFISFFNFPGFSWRDPPLDPLQRLHRPMSRLYPRHPLSW